MFDRSAAIALLESRGAEQWLRSRWRLDDAVDVIVESDRWLARVYLAEVAPDDPECLDQWCAEGWSVQSLEHFLRTWIDPIRPVPGSWTRPKEMPS